MSVSRTDDVVIKVMEEILNREGGPEVRGLPVNKISSVKNLIGK